MSRAHPTTTEERALELLGSGVQAESVAAALGVTPSYISQLLSDSSFSDAVTARRYEALQKHNTRDEAYDRLEDALVTKLEKALPMMYKPAEILSAIKTINGANRRGQSTPQQITNQQNIVQLVLPATIKQSFTTNIANQVVKAGEQDLLTLPSSSLLAKAEQEENDRLIDPPTEEEVTNNSAL